MKSYFNPNRWFSGFNKQERSGIFFLLSLITVFLLLYFGLSEYPSHDRKSLFVLDEEYQRQYDSLVTLTRSQEKLATRSFNPNYISDFKGYTLGLSAEEMDRLTQFRNQNEFVNSAEEFQLVTGVSDSLLNEIAPFFKFPDWVTNKRKATSIKTSSPVGSINVLDLNKATTNDLRQISGIGEKLSSRIVRFRDRLGGFLTDEQLYDVYGLEAVVVERALKRFRVLNPPTVEKININSADVEELASLVYLKYHVAQNIVTYREENGLYTSFDDLFNVSGFPVNKIDRIALYLSY